MVRILERDDELGVLAEVVDEAVGGRGRLVLIGGEAGIGKSTLVEALGRRVGTRASVLRGACEPLSVPVPLAPVRELVEAAGGGELLGAEGGDRLVLARRVAGALEPLGPAVAVIEDAHWADPLTLDLVRLLARRLPRMHLVMILTFRDDEVAANSALALLLGDLAGATAVRRVELKPLSKAAVAELAGSSGLDPGELVRVTGGNPFLVAETIAAGGRLPTSVRDAALARAGRLSSDARHAVDAAAVIGQRFDHALLELVAPGSTDAVEEALARGVLVAEGMGLGFRHELIREAIESSISPPRRSELHARVVAALAGQGGGADSARLAHHAELAGLPAEACRYATLASREAEHLGALRETRMQAERALRLGDGLAEAERLELLLRHSRAANFSSTRLEDAETSAREAVGVADRLGDPLLRARALGLLASALWSLDRVAEAKAMAKRAAELLQPGGDPAALARALSTSIRMEATAFNPEAAIEAEPRALELARRAGLEEVEIDVAISVALARGHRGERRALALLADALAAAKQAGLRIQTVRTYVNLAFLGAIMREHAFVDATAQEALELFDDFGATIPGYAIELYRARSLLDRGLWDEALATLTRTDRDWVSETAVVWALQGLLRARRGELDGHPLLERAWRELERVPPSSRHGTIRVALVEAAWLLGDRGAALEQLQAARASPATKRFARTGGELALWAARHALDLQPPAGVPRAIELELEGDWRGAIRAWREVEAPYEAALAALPGDDRAAREALGTLHRLGAAAAAHAFLRDRAARGGRSARGPRRSTLAHPAGLTRREQEILEQLATGATNPAIAEAMHLSERTVAHHVSAVLTKLGAGTRTAAIESARRRGLLSSSQDGPVERPT